MSEPPYNYPLSPQDWANQFAAQTGRTPTQADYEQALAAGYVQPVDAPAQPGYPQGGYAQDPYAQGTYAQQGYEQGAYAQDPYAQDPYAQGAYAGYPAPQKKSALPLILGISGGVVALLVIVALILIFVVPRGSNNTSAEASASASESPSASASSSSASPSPSASSSSASASASASRSASATASASTSASAKYTVDQIAGTYTAKSEVEGRMTDFTLRLKADGTCGLGVAATVDGQYISVDETLNSCTWTINAAGTHVNMQMTTIDDTQGRDILRIEDKDTLQSIARKDERFTRA